MFASLLIMLPCLLKSETITFDTSGSAPNIIQCVDPSTDCVINCQYNSICRFKHIHCHNESTTASCRINLINANAARDAFIYTHKSPIVYINVIGSAGCYNTIIYAHQSNAKLYFYVTGGGYALRQSTIYSPVGEGSLLSLECEGSNSCRNMKIYDDQSTEVYMQPFGSGSYVLYQTEIKNIFDNSTLNISRSDDDYNGLNLDYRAPVFFNGCDQLSTNAWQLFKYYGHNHGDWILYGLGRYSFHKAEIYATADTAPNNGIDAFNIKVMGTLMGNTTDDSLTGDGILQNFKLDTKGNNANIYVEVTDNNGFNAGQIYARDANSVNIYCHEGGDCYNILVECPEDNQNNTCRIFCDDDSTTDCRNMNIYTTNGYCRDTTVFCLGNDCLITGDKIYCGYDQTVNYCQLTEIGTTGQFACNNVGSGYCNNSYTEELCHNETLQRPIAISSTFQAECNEFPTMEPTEDPTTAPSNSPSQPPTIAPSNAPTSPPTMHPSSAPTKPSFSPTIAPTSAPTMPPTIEARAEVGNDASVGTTAQAISNQGAKDGESSAGNAILIIAIAGCVLCVIVVIAVIYSVTKRKQRSDSMVMEINMAQSVGSKSHTDVREATDTELVSSGSINDLDGGFKMTPRPPPRNLMHNKSQSEIYEQDDDLKMEEEKPRRTDTFVVEGEDEIEDKGTVDGAGTDEGTDLEDTDDEHVQATKGDDHDFGQELNDNVLGNDLLMDDIVNAMNETPN